MKKNMLPFPSLAFLAVAMLSTLAYTAQLRQGLTAFYEHDDTPKLIAPGLVSTTDGEYSPTFDVYTNELYFMRRTPGAFDYTIYRSKLRGASWSEPQVVSFSGDHRDAAPYLSPDGQTLLFDSRRPASEVAENSINLWSVERTATGWGEPHLLSKPSENATDEPKVGRDEFGPAMDDAGQLYFYSFRRPYRAGARYRVAPPAYDEVRRETTIPDPSANTFVSYLYVSPNGKMAIMEGRATGRRDSDLFCSCRQADGSWSDALPLELVNTASGEGGPFLSADGNWLFFTSDRNTQHAKVGNANLYLVSAEVLPAICRKALTN